MTAEELKGCKDVAQASERAALSNIYDPKVARARKTLHRISASLFSCSLSLLFFSRSTFRIF